MTAEQYITLSGLAYETLFDNAYGFSIGYLISEKMIKEKSLSKPELSKLNNIDNPLRSWTLIKTVNSASGLSAAAFQAPDNPDGTKGEIVFSFRGTEANTWQDIMADLQLASIGTPAVGPNQFYDAEQFVSSVLASNVNSGYTLTGHSLGGAVAQYVAYKTNHGATTFDAPGIAQLLPLGTNMHRTDVIDYVNKNDLIGNYGIPYGVTRVIDSGAGVGLGDTGLAVAMMASPVSGVMEKLIAATILKESRAELQQGASDNPLMDEHNMASMLDENGNMREHLPPGGTQIAGAAVGVIVGAIALPFKLGNALVYAIGDSVAGLIFDGADGVQKVWNFSEKTVNQLAYYSKEGVTKFIDTSIVITKGISSVTIEPFYNDIIYPAGQALADLTWNTYSGIKSAYDLLVDPTSLIYGKAFTGTGQYDSVNGTALGDYINIGDGGGYIRGYDGNDTLIGGKDNDTIYGGKGNDTIYGSDGDNNIQGDEGDDIIYGGAEVDWISGGYGDDYIDGGGGAYNELSGQDGNDTYVIKRGCGDTRIYDKNYDISIGYPKEAVVIHKAGDKILFDPSIALDDLIITRSDFDLFLRIKGTSDKVTVVNFFAGTLGFGFGEIPWFQFHDGSVISMDQIRYLAQTGIDEGQQIWGTSGNDTLYGAGGDDVIFGGSGDDVIDGGEGNDTIYDNYSSEYYLLGRTRNSDGNNIINGGSGNDTIKSGTGNDIVHGGTGNDILQDEGGSNRLYGDDGNDQIYGNSGNDLIDGGTGDDYLDGGEGNDIYILGHNYGNDTIFEKSALYINETDTIKFKEDITPEDVILERVDADLIVKIKNSSGDITSKLIVQNHFGMYNHVTHGYDKFNYYDRSIEQLIFSNGTTWDNGMIEYKTFSYSSPIYGSSGTDIIQGNLGNDVTIYALDGDDILYGSSGNDRLFGGNGNDMYMPNGGNDTIVDQSGDDSYYITNIASNVEITDQGTATDNDRLLINGGGGQYVFTKNNLDLIVTNQHNSLVTIKDWFNNTSSQIETIVSMDDYAALSSTNVNLLIQAMAGFSAQNNGMSWSQALIDRPSEVASIVSQYWTAYTG